MDEEDEEEKQNLKTKMKIFVNFIFVLFKCKMAESFSYFGKCEVEAMTALFRQ